MDPKALETAKLGLGRAEKVLFGPFSAFQGLGKTGRSLKGFPKDWEGILAREGVEGICRHLGTFWGFPAI